MKKGGVFLNVDLKIHRLFFRPYSTLRTSCCAYMFYTALARKSSRLGLKVSSTAPALIQTEPCSTFGGI